MTAGNPIKPSIALLCKLASITVHAEEFLSPDGHAFDRLALGQLLADAEVREWLEKMAEAGLSPRKR